MTKLHKIEMAASIPLLATLAACTTDQTPTRFSTPTPTIPVYRVDQRIEANCQWQQGNEIRIGRINIGSFDPGPGRQIFTIPNVFLIESDFSRWDILWGQENIEPSRIQSFGNQSFIIHNRTKSPEQIYLMSVSDRYSEITPIRFFFIGACQKAQALLSLAQSLTTC